MTEQAMEGAVSYQVFDSCDRACSAPAPSEADLYGTLAALREEEEEEPMGLTYAIAQVSPDGSVSFDY